MADDTQDANMQNEAAPALKRGSRLPPGYVYARITKRGHDKVFTGETRAPKFNDDGSFDRMQTFPTHSAGEIIKLPLKVAQAQEANGYVEIQD